MVQYSYKLESLCRIKNFFLTKKEESIMREEKVKYVDLPNGVIFHKAKVTEDGKKVAVSYSFAEDIQNVSKKLPKPTPLVGGTEVYQKEGLPYWFCKIKDGRDEFMHFYFGDLTENDLIYWADGRKREFFTDRKKRFKTVIRYALDNMPKYKDFRWIPVYPPSMNADGNLQFISSRRINLLKKNTYNLVQIFQTYSPENESDMTSITVYWLLLLRLLKDGVATIEQLAGETKAKKQYWDCKDSDEPLLGGDVFKIVRDEDAPGGFSLLGNDGYNNGNIYPRNCSSGLSLIFGEQLGFGLLELK